MKAIFGMRKSVACPFKIDMSGVQISSTWFPGLWQGYVSNVQSYKS